VRGFFRVGLVVTAVGPVGCAQTWDTIGNKSWQRDFTRNPLRATVSPDDPLTILRDRPNDGEARARAMRRLDEPLTKGRSQEDQNEALGYLQAGATLDPSPVVRASAIEALGRFEDPRVPEILAAAFHQAGGPGAQPAADPTQPGMLSARTGLFGPTGYSPEVATMLRIRAVDALAKTGRPEAVAFLADLALPKPDVDPAETRDVRIAAVRGLSTMRRPEAVNALSRILDAEKGRDVAVVARVHAGLMDLTGRDLPPDPQQWNEVVQAGFEVKPEPNPFQRAVGWILP
jgi:PBS lyase HEAT-like repeat